MKAASFVRAPRPYFRKLVRNSIAALARSRGFRYIVCILLAVVWSMNTLRPFFEGMFRQSS